AALRGRQRGRAVALDPPRVGAAEYVPAVDARARDLREAIDPGREVGPDVALQPTRARDGADQAELLRIALAERARFLEAPHHGRRCPEQVDRVAGVAQCGGYAVAHLRRALLVDVEADTTRPAHAAAHTAPADGCREIQPVAAQTPAERRRGQEADVARERAQGSGVVGQPLELERDAADDLGTRRRGRASEPFQRLGA